MASTSTMSTWIEELAASLQPASSIKTKRLQQRAINTFRRQVQRHPFARTNQFDVSDQMDGLEEKFQVMNREDLSDALYQRRIELRSHHERWIPDVLDLILRLSDNPLRKTDVSNLLANEDSLEAPIILKWADIEADDPVDRSNHIWKMPVFSDLSSDEDDIESSTASTSPDSMKQKAQPNDQPNDQRDIQIFEDHNHGLCPDLQTLHNLASKDPCTDVMTEIELVRHALLAVQGFDSRLFGSRSQRPQPVLCPKLRNMSSLTVHAFIKEVSLVSLDVHVVSEWTDRSSSIRWIQTVKQSAQGIIQDFNSTICALEESLLHPHMRQVTSLLVILGEIEQARKPLAVFTEWVRQVNDADPITALSTLHDTVSEYYFANNTAGTATMLPIFIKAFLIYMDPILHWLETGNLTSNSEPFFIRIRGTNTPMARLWHEWFELNNDSVYRTPAFLEDIAQNILVCGKTTAFIKNIMPSQNNQHAIPALKRSLAEAVEVLAVEPMIPFPAALRTVIHTSVSNLLSLRTLVLKDLLDTKCGMSRTLDAFEHLYLRRNGVLLDNIESRMFSRIDRCMDNWNDRFLVADMLEDVYMDTDCVDIGLITVNSTHTSSRSMESRRRSVRILGALTIDYILPWPVANIISLDTLAAYRRIALHLTQIRRAKYVLERTAFIHVNSVPISEDIRDQLLAQTTAFMLIQFTNTLYNHFTAGVSQPLTQRMRTDLRTASTVDDMIGVHRSYISNLEFACLTSVPVKTLRETLVGLLDMCIRFADLVSTPSNAAAGADRRRNSSADFEAGSFVSAQSRHGRRKRGRLRQQVLKNTVGFKQAMDDGMEESSSEEDEDEDDDGGGGEGYSSFIVLEEDTSVAKEVRKLRALFQRQLDFFVAGLRGVGRGGTGMMVEEFETLADRLDWKRK